MIYLAPIRGITDVTYRNIFSKYFTGVDLAVAPFISTAKARSLKPSFFKDILPANNTRMKVIPQVLSNNSDDFLFIAKQIYELGYTTINWNLGCPAPMVANKKRGSGLLPFPDLINAFLENVCGKFQGEVSIKMRLGRNDSLEIEELLPILDQYPLSDIIIHPRIGIQMYKGNADPLSFKKCRGLTRHKLIYNGDIIDVNSFKKLQQLLPGTESWMIGRGLLADPFLAAEICDESNSRLKTGEYRDILKCFHDELYENYQAILFGPSHLIGRMKGIWSYMINIFYENSKLIKIINKTNCPIKYTSLIDSFFKNEELLRDR